MMKRTAENAARRSKAPWLMAATLVLATPVQDTDARAVDQRPAPFRLRITLVDAVGLPGPVHQAVRDELGRILRAHDIGVEVVGVEEYAAEVSAAGDPAADIVQVLILPRDGAAWGVSADAMGGAPPGREVGVCEAVYVFHPVVLRALRAGRRRPEPTRVHVGRAIGRVIVHELVHRLAPGRPHADHGLMADALRRPELTGPGVDLDPASAGALRRGLKARSGSS